MASPGAKPAFGGFEADVAFCTANVRFRGKADMTFLREFAFAVAIGGKADMPFCTAYVCL